MGARAGLVKYFLTLPLLAAFREGLAIHTKTVVLKMGKLHVEGVIVCVNYSDMLAHTLAAAKAQFNRLVVVTDTKDDATKNLCEYHHVECVRTDVFYENGDKFNKGKAINAGLARLSRKGWVVQDRKSVV